MRSVWGGNVCAPTWATFMRKALEVHKREHEQEKKTQETKQRQSATKNGFSRQPRTDNTPPGREKTTVSICTDSGLLATRNCPTTYRVSYDISKRPLTYCNIHGSENGSPPADGQTPQPATTPETAGPNQTDNNGPERPGTSTSTESRYVNVTICVDSGQVANEYCPETVTRRYLATDAPSRVCRTHRPSE